MPVKKDGSGKRWVEMEFLAPGTPEEIWRAMATGPGYAAWFIKASIEERVGGVLRFEFGPGVSTSGEVTAWEPPVRFGYVETDWMEGAPPVATEITITGRAGGQCVVRMVHSLFTSKDDWDDQLESFQGGWPGFFEVLRLYLTHFTGQRGTPFQVMAMGVGSEDLPVWTRLTEALGLAGANVGEQRTAASGPQALSGVVERVHQDRKVRWITMRLSAPAPGIAIIGTYRGGDGVNASMSLFFYGDDAEQTAATSEPKWRDWLGKTFPSVSPAVA
ncbi:MAG: SRPBCC family protein [Hyphomicrobiaceae bacterium]